MFIDSFTRPVSLFRGAMASRSLTTTLHDEATEPLSSRVRAIVEDAGYVRLDEARRRPHDDGPAGHYVCDEIDVGIPGTRSYDFRVFEDPERPVIDLVSEALRCRPVVPDLKAVTLAELCERLRSNPTRALGARSPQTLNAYLLGYAAAIKHDRTAQLVDETGGKFGQWVNSQIELTHEHASRLNAGSAFGPAALALLASEDEHCAFETWLDLEVRCINDVKSTTAPERYDSIPGDHSLFSLLATIRKRPGMYFGDGRVEHCFALINGYSDAESDHGVSSLETARMKKFQPWVDERYPFGHGHPWFRVFRLLAINPDRGCEVFFGELDLFIAGDPPDTPDPSMTQMLDAIIEHGRRSADKSNRPSRNTNRKRRLRVKKTKVSRSRAKKS
jgi:hypothetical protein